MSISLAGLARGVLVTFSSVAHHECVRRFGAYDLVMTWEEVQALAAGVQEVYGGERMTRLQEGLKFFAIRQGVTLE